MDNAYLDFASVYDELMDNVPYDDWFEYILSILHDNNITKGASIVELGCGTGQISERLSACGYNVTGIDISLDMLEQANQKRIQNCSSTLYVCQDMCNFTLPSNVDAIICVCDSLNYATEHEDLFRLMQCVHNSLNKGGIFIFDFNTLHYYRDSLGDCTIAEDRDDISFIWGNYFDNDTKINQLSLSIFTRNSLDSDQFTKHEELHLQRGYTLSDISNTISDSGLALQYAYEAFTDNPATEVNDRIYIIASRSK